MFFSGIHFTVYCIFGGEKMNPLYIDLLDYFTIIPMNSLVENKWRKK